MRQPILGVLCPAFLVLTLITPALGEPLEETPESRTVETSPESEQAVPFVIHYQGRFGDPGGIPLPGPVNLTFRIYGVATGGSALWSEAHTQVPLNEGVASVLLGSLVSLPADVFSAPTRYLSVAVNTAAELTPRLRIGSVPFAVESERLGGKTAADFESRGAVLGLSVGDGSPPNVGSNRLHWSNLTGVPEGFADGEDLGLTAHGELDGLDNDDHPQYARRDDLVETIGVGPNTGKNLVHWDNLLGVPSGFADGADNTGSGGASDHGDLTGLEDDDHPQYALDTDLLGHTQFVDPHTQYSLDTDLSLHAGNPANHHAKTVNAAELTEGVLDPARLPSEGITGAQIQDGTVGREDLVAGLLDTLLVTPGSVDSTILASGAVRTVHIAAGAVGTAQLTPGAVDSGVVLDGSLNGEDILDESLTGTDIRDASLTVAELSNGTGFQEAYSGLNQAVGDVVETLLSQSIDCPSDGWVLAVGSTQACVTPPPVAGTYGLSLAITDTLGVLDAESVVQLRGYIPPGGYLCNSLVSQKVFAVSAGLQTFHLVVQGPNSGNGSVERPRISLVFLPTRY